MSAINGGMAVPVEMRRLTGITSASTLTLPAGYMLRSIAARANNANAVTGGLKVGTTLGGVDVLAALALAGSALSTGTALIGAVSAADRTIYVDAVVAWNSANVDLAFVMVKVF